MSKKPLLVLLLGSSLVLAGCHSSEEASSSSASSSIESLSSDSSSDSSSSSSVSSTVVEETKYYLTGDLAVESKNRIELSKNGDAYTSTGLILRRGDSFTIQKDDSSVASYANLTNNKGFISKENGFIGVLNEGIYDVSFKDGDTPSLTLTKTDSSYDDVKLVLSDGTSTSFVMNDDFTYSLSNVNLSYRENFYISLDNNKLSFSDYNYNDLYAESLHFDENKVNVISKGTFHFALDFANEGALTVTSSNLKKPQAIPTNAQDYQDLIDSFEYQFADEGTEFNMTQTVTTFTNGNVEAEKTYYKETMSSKEHYCYEKDGNKENAVIHERSYVMNDTNYYEISKYTNSTNDSSLKGYLLGEAPEKEETNESSTIVTVDKNYITKDNAIKKMRTMPSKSSYLVADYLLYVAEVKHTSSPTDAEKAKYLETLELSGEYAGTIGDSINLTAKNVEKHWSSTSSSGSAAKNTITFTVDSEGHLLSGTILVEKYSGSNEKLFDNSTDMNLLSSAPLTETDKYEFTFEYGDRSEVEYKLDPVNYTVSEFEVSPSQTIINGSTFTCNLSYYLPLDALDSSSIQIVEYDSAYFNVNNDGSYMAKKAGKTSVYVGNLYSNFKEEIKVEIKYDEAVSVNVSKAEGGSITTYGTLEYYAGGEAEFVAEVNSATADPAVSVKSSDETKVIVSKLDDADSQRQSRKVKFTLKMLAETTNDVKITVSSVGTPSKYTEFSIKVLTPLIMDDFAGTYYFGYHKSSTNEDGDFYSLSIDSNGNAKFTNETDSLEYSFKAKIDGAALVLDKATTNNEIASFSATSSSITAAGEKIKAVIISSCTANDGTDFVAEQGRLTYSKELFAMTEKWSKMDTFAMATDSTNNAKWEVLSLTGAQDSGRSPYAPSAKVKVTYVGEDNEENVLAFNWVAPSQYLSTTSIDKNTVELNGTNIYHWSLGCEISIVDNTLTLTVKRTYDPYKIDVSFTFTINKTE